MASCSQCGAAVPAGGTHCPSCGASVTTPPRSEPIQIKFDASAFSQTDRVVFLGTLVLFASLFMSWYSANTGFGVVTLDALWHGYMYIPLLFSIVLLAYFGAIALGIWSMPTSSPLSAAQASLVITAVNFVLVLIAFLDKPPGGWGWAYGSFVGLIASIVALLPLARPAIAARQNRS